MTIRHHRCQMVLTRIALALNLAAASLLATPMQADAALSVRPTLNSFIAAGPIALLTSSTELESRSRQFVADYYAALSADSETALAFIRRNYGTDVSFFGRWLDVGGVAQRRAKLFERWPQRDYQPSQSSIQVICNNVSRKCRVQTIVDWTLGNPGRDQVAKGIERSVLVIAYDGERPVIVFEGGETLSR